MIRSSLLTALLLGFVLSCTTLKVATPEQAAALDDLDWQVQRPEAPTAAPEAKP